MRAGQRAQGKLQALGASPHTAARGAQQQRHHHQQPPPPPQPNQHIHQNQQQQQLQPPQQQQQLPNLHHHQHFQELSPLHQQMRGGVGVVVKEEPLGVAQGGGGEGAGWEEEGGGAVTTPWRKKQSCRLLRQTIMERRQALGLGDISPHSSSSSDDAEASCFSPVQHELSPEELEKKERRKEQNRRAAKKCRLKKKQNQNHMEGDFAKIREDNLKLEAEKSSLNAEIASLRKKLDDHLQSGECCQVQPLDNAGPPSGTTPAWTAAHSTDHPCVQPYEHYLEGLDLSPEHTFTDLDLDTLVNLAQLVSSEDLNALVLQHHQQQQQHDRHSVSSVTSDWSVVSDQSQGFGQVPTQGGWGGVGSPSRVGLGRGGSKMTTSSLNSTGDYWEADSPVYGQQGAGGMGVPMDSDVNDLEDEVFAERPFGP